jgi:heme-degrading monooxygenase HmoA
MDNRAPVFKESAMSEPFASLPEPPYYAVIFSSTRTDIEEGYGEAADHMVELARQQPGFLGLESTRGESGFGITVSYWESEEAIREWRRHVEHTAARDQGRARWYARFEVRIARVERAYGWDRGHGHHRGGPGAA